MFSDIVMAGFKVYHPNCQLYFTLAQLHAAPTKWGPDTHSQRLPSAKPLIKRFPAQSSVLPKQSINIPTFVTGSSGQALA